MFEIKKGRKNILCLYKGVKSILNFAAQFLGIGVAERDDFVVEFIGGNGEDIIGAVLGGEINQFYNDLWELGRYFLHDSARLGTTPAIFFNKNF